MKETVIYGIIVIGIALFSMFLVAYFEIVSIVIKNPYVNKNSFKRKSHVWMCGKKRENCIKVGPHYGMQQSHCRRCGRINANIASENSEMWSVPWGEFK
jgi:hypothetical protein